ncbi:MAG: hypothetical protein V1798_02540 [Pseudomonadota bacterium]
MRGKEICGITLLALLASGQAGASMVEQLDTTRLTKQARWIHVGQVTDSWSSPDSSNGMIFTYVKMHVEQTVKGEPAQEVLIRIPGGRFRDHGMIVHGMVRFSRGERALVFLDSDREGNPSVVGLAQGKFRVYKSPVNGEDMAMFQAPSDLEVISRTATGSIRQVVATQVERRVLLKSLLSDIRSAMSETETVH